MGGILAQTVGFTAFAYNFNASPLGRIYYKVSFLISLLPKDDTAMRLILNNVKNLISAGVDAGDKQENLQKGAAQQALDSLLLNEKDNNTMAAAKKSLQDRLGNGVPSAADKKRLKEDLGNDIAMPDNEFGDFNWDGLIAELKAFLKPKTSGNTSSISMGVGNANSPSSPSDNGSKNGGSVTGGTTWDDVVSEIAGWTGNMNNNIILDQISKDNQGMTGDYIAQIRKLLNQAGIAANEKDNSKTQGLLEQILVALQEVRGDTAAKIKIAIQEKIHKMKNGVSQVPSTGSTEAASIGGKAPATVALANYARNVFCHNAKRMLGIPLTLRSDAVAICSAVRKKATDAQLANLAITFCGKATTVKTLNSATKNLCAGVNAATSGIKSPTSPGDNGKANGTGIGAPPAGGEKTRPGPVEVKAEIIKELDALIKGKNSEVPAPSLEIYKGEFWPPISANGPFTLSKIATGEVKVKDELCKELNALYDKLRQNIYDSDMTPADKDVALMSFSLAPEDRCDVGKVTAALFAAFQVPKDGGGAKLQVKVRGLAVLLVNLNAQANAFDNLAKDIGTRAANIVYGLGDPAANRKAKEALLDKLRQGANAYNYSKALLELYGLGLKSARLLTDPGFFRSIYDQLVDIVSEQEKGRLTTMATNDVINTGSVSQRTQDEIDKARSR